MRVLDDYEISIHGLKDGVHNYDFKITREFFESYSYPDLTDGDLMVSLVLQKSFQVIELEFNISGFMELNCDRCNEVYSQEVSRNEKLYIRFGEKFEELDDNIIVIPRNESHINVAQYIFEIIALSLPYRKIHPDLEDGTSGCNPNTIKILQELNGLSDTEIIETDPRWDKLKIINTNN